MKIVITTSGGTINSVYCDSEDAEVVIIDADDLTDSQYEVMLDDETLDLHTVY